MGESPIGFEEGIALADSIEKNKDDTARPRFYRRAVHMKFESNKQGRPVYEDREYVEIIIPGQPKSIVDRPVSEQDKQRWPRSYKMWKDRLEPALNGTPIENANFLTPAQVAMLKALNILTVEDLAALGDTGLDKVGMGARELQKKARAFIAPAPQREQELRAENAALKTRLGNIEAQMQQLLAAQPKPAEPEAPATAKPAPPLALKKTS